MTKTNNIIFTLLVDGNRVSFEAFKYINTLAPGVNHISQEELEEVKNLKVDESVFIGIMEVKRIE